VRKKVSRFLYILKLMSWRDRMNTALIFLILFLPMCFFLEKSEWPILIFWGLFSWFITYYLIDP
jgi:uncharacterized membrane protein YjjB (DUF3815 family)